MFISKVFVIIFLKHEYAVKYNCYEIVLSTLIIQKMVKEKEKEKKENKTEAFQQIYPP